MDRKARKNKFNAVTLVIICIVAILLFSVAFVWFGSHNSLQSALPTVAGVKFQGDYKIGDGDWNEIIEGEHITSTKGDVTLRGIFYMCHPTSGEVLRMLSPGTTVALYFNHIGGYMALPENRSYIFDAESPNLGEDACAVMWGSITVIDEAPITIVLHNPHGYGNENAIDDFFENMSIAPGSYFEGIMLEKGAVERHIGQLIVIAGMVILGIAVFSTVIHIKRCKEMWLIGLLSLFAGGYLLFDAFAVSIWNGSFIMNTRMLGLCMMLYMLFCSILISVILKEKVKKVAIGAIFASATSILICISLAFFTEIKFFDTWFWWAVSEVAVAIVLIVCLILNFRRSKLEMKYLNVIGIITLAAFSFDYAATWIGWWQGGLISKFVFFVIFILSFVVILHVIPTHINAAIRAKELEAEQRMLKQELQESRISIMLSQMQPHFIFNTLNTIYHLCDIDPNKARSTISSFSAYLRNNIDNLGQSEMIFFEKELSFVKAYLDIEKVRFDDELLISFDIETSNFKLPVLTVQPIVENAVKHGTSKKEGVSCLHIATRETEYAYEIEIRDTGVGFDSNAVQTDGHKHIGIANVRQRLESLCNGSLIVESAPDAGTTVTIRIPKREENLK